jgi:MFS family permease
MTAWFISGVGGSIYYTYSRPYLLDKLGSGGYYVVGLLVAAEQIPAALAVFSGFLADLFGRRNLLLLGVLNAPLYILLGYIDPRMIPLVIGFTVFIGSISGPASMGMILSATGRSGRAYSMMAFSSAIGWVVGGIIPGLLRDMIGPVGLFSLTAVLGLVSVIIQYVYAPEKMPAYEKPRIREIGRVLENTWDLVVSMILANSALSLFYNSMALKVYEELHRNLLLYGLALSTSTALAGALARPVSGVLVDKYDPMIIITVSLISYVFLDTGIYLSTGILRLLLRLLSP